MSDFLHIARSVPDYCALPTMNELTARTRAVQADPLVRVTVVGASRSGVPIEMISVGNGPRSALLVGTPHPNEPIGCLSAEFLIERLRLDHALREQLGYTWHFIKSIEPDGLRYNEGWLKRPGDVGSYFRHFFRPAAREQAEYCFPLTAGAYRFAASTPENLAWQEALRRTRPGFLFSLHNNEHGGAFYILSQAFPQLAVALAIQPAHFGIPLDPVGESFDPADSMAPGIFRSGDIAATVQENGHAWHAGQSSFGFCAPIGTFGLMVEVPFWQEAPVDPAAPAMTLAEVLAPAVGWGCDALHLLDAYLPALIPRSPAEERFHAALIDMRAAVARRIQSYRAPPPLTLNAQQAAIQRRVARMQMLRPVALLSRLGGGDPAIAHYLDGALSCLPDGMQAVSLRAAVATQVLAALTTAAMLKERG